MATYDASTRSFTYYLLGNNYSVVGTGNADGSKIEPLEYSPTGDFSGNRPTSDFDGDGDVDQADFAALEGCWSGPGATPATGCEGKDLDRDSDVDGQDYALFQPCMSGENNPAPAGCQGQPPSGSFTLHGLTVDVLPDGKALVFARARHYDPKHGRWLQRDPKGYVDGPNLYEAFGGNPLVNVDPEGTDILEWIFGKKYVERRKRSAKAHHAYLKTVTITDPRDIVTMLLNDSLRARGLPERDFEAEKQAAIAAATLKAALTEAEAFICISDRIKSAGSYKRAISLGMFSGAMVKVPLTEGGTVTRFWVMPLETYAQAQEAERIRAALSGHNCAAMDGLAAISGSIPAFITQGNSIGISMVHGFEHLWYGDEAGGWPRVFGGLLPFLFLDDAVRFSSVGMVVADEYASVGRVAAAPANPMLPVRTNTQLVQDIATRAEAWGTRQGLATTGSVEGTLKHGYADRLLSRYQQMFGDRGLSTEVRYLNRQVWQPGMSLKGTIRLDVVEGQLTSPIAVYDYKFGGASLSPARVNEIRAGANLGPTVPVWEVNP